MKNLTKKEQYLMADKILEEMNFAEKNLNNSGFSWFERCDGIRCDELKTLTKEQIELLQKKYGDNYELRDYFEREVNNYLPIRKVKLTDDFNKKYICEFENVCWYGVNTKRSKRIFKFQNDGNIYYEKNWIGSLNIRRSKGISYNITYNVLDNSYEIEYFEEKYDKSSFNDITLCYKDDVLSEKLNNVSIDKNIKTKERKIDVSSKRKRGRYSIDTKLSMDLNGDNKINKASLVAKVSKERKEGITSYIFNIEDGKLKAYYNKGENIIDITNDSKLFNLAINLIIGGEEILEPEFKIISDYLTSIVNGDVTFDSINEVENKVIETIKEVKGEVPLKGFVERFENSLNKNNERIKV